MAAEDHQTVAAIPVTSVARTLLDLAEVIDERTLERAFEGADRLGLLEMRSLEAVCARGRGRRGLKPLRRLIEEARAPEPTRSPLEDRVLALCREHDLPLPQVNVEVAGREVDAFWPRERLMVEADSWSFHRHRAAFERDRARDAAMQADGYRVIRLTHRRMDREPDRVAAELRRLLAAGRDSAPCRPALEAGRLDVPALRPPYGWSTAGTSRAAERGGEQGQGTVEWVGLTAVVALLLVAILAAGARVPGVGLAQAVASKILCAAALADSCGDEPALIAAYGTEVGGLVREHMPSIAFERGSRALPVDFRRCRNSACGDGSTRGLVDRTDRGLPVTAFVHVVDCRNGPSDDAARAELTAEAECSAGRAGNLYIQYWLYYADSATLRGIPIAGAAGYHRDDWESAQIRIGPDGSVDERASSHHGYNHRRGVANLASDAGSDSLSGIAETVGARPASGWGPQRGLLRVSGGSHAGNASGYLNFDRVAPASRIHLVPLEPLTTSGTAYRFAVSPPWRKRAWRDPEATGTD